MNPREEARDRWPWNIPHPADLLAKGDATDKEIRRAVRGRRKWEPVLIAVLAVSAWAVLAVIVLLAAHAI